MSTSLLNKKVIIVAVLAAGAVSTFLVVSSIAQATAQQQHKMWSGEGIPQINGSVSVANEASNFVNENVKVSFVKGAETAQGKVTDGNVLGGHLGVVQGYLVYTFFVASTTNQTGYLVIVDTGNDEVLYTSQGQPLGSFGHWYGHWGGQGHGGWGENWKAHSWGTWN